MKKILLSILTASLAGLIFSQTVYDKASTFYPFDGNANDISINEVHGEATDITYLEDRYGNPMFAASFNGTTSKIEIPNSEAGKPGFPFSLSVWVKINTFENDSIQRIFFNDNESSDYEGVGLSVWKGGEIAFGFGLGGQARYSWNRAGYNLEESDFDFQQWTNITYTVRGIKDISLFVNGEEIAGEYTGETTNQFSYSSSKGSFGYRSECRYCDELFFDGALDDGGVWDYSLSQEEVTELYQEGYSEDICTRVVIIYDTIRTVLYDTIQYATNDTLILNPVINSLGLSKIYTVKVFPNPAKSSIIISCLDEKLQQENLTFAIATTTGEIVRSQDLTDNQEENIEDLSPGLYIITIIDAKGNTKATKKLLIN